MNLELTVTERLAVQTKRLQDRVALKAPAVGDEELTLESLAVLSEALLRLSRDVRQIRLQTAERA